PALKTTLAAVQRKATRALPISGNRPQAVARDHSLAIPAVRTATQAWPASARPADRQTAQQETSLAPWGLLAKAVNRTRDPRQALPAGAERMARLAQAAVPGAVPAAAETAPAAALMRRPR